MYLPCVSSTFVAQKSSKSHHDLLGPSPWKLTNHHSMAAAKLAKELGGKADLQVPKRHGHGWNLEWGGDRMRIGQTDGSSLARCTQPSGDC